MAKTRFCDIKYVDEECFSCGEPARIIVYNTKKIKCPSCDSVCYTEGSEFPLCKINCENEAHGFWYCDNYDIFKNGSYTYLRCYCNWDFECNQCRRSEHIETEFQCQIDSELFCAYCTNYARYNFSIEDDACCKKCNNIIYNKGNIIRLCSTMCDKKQSNYTKYLTSKDDPIIRIRHTFRTKCKQCDVKNILKVVIRCNRDGSKVV